ncbi:MAG: hypothetical protein COA45_08870 [Zetaproteobacteria bacterium]|nr:MAG: hypothetical protein COA45_08870 [Zetaproteobacteria bacterium]
MHDWVQKDYQATLHVSKTRYNVSDFVRNNKKELWKIFVPLMPFIVGLYLLDAVISDLYYSDGEIGTGVLNEIVSIGAVVERFEIGALIANYFLVCLAISWHRIVIQGVDSYTPMKPFSPKKHELVFIGVGILGGIVYVLIFALMTGVMLYLSSIGYEASMIAVYGALFFWIFLPLMTYIFYRFCLYFPAKAVNAKITLRKAFSLSGGHLWRLLFVMIRATFIWDILALVYILSASMASFAIQSFFQIPSWEYMISFVLYLPVLLYFLPILTVLGVTALSNYYLYAVQNDNEAVKG